MASAFVLLLIDEFMLGYWSSGRRRSNHPRFGTRRNRIHATTEAHSSEIGNASQTPSAPMMPDSRKLKGMVMTNWRSRDTMRESFPRPRASKVPEQMTPTVEMTKPRLMIRSAEMPASNSASSASNIANIWAGKPRAATVPTAMMTAAESRLYRMTFFTRSYSPAP